MRHREYNINTSNALRNALLVTLCAAWATICFILPDFCDAPVDGWKSVAILGVYLAAFGLFQLLIIYLLSINKTVFAVTLPIYALVGSALAYYRVAFSSTPTPMLVESVLNTNASEAHDVISWQAIAYVAINLTIAALFVNERRKTENPRRQWIHYIVAILLIFTYYNFNSRLSFSLRQRYPANIIHACTEYAHIRQMQKNTILQDPVISEQTTHDSLTVVLVVGEAMRADHLQLNGYPRPTTPRLAARRNVVSLPHIYSEHTHTAASLPHIITPADSLHNEYAYSYHSCVSVFRRCGYQTAWISNQDMGRTYSNFIHEADTYHFPNADKSVFVFSDWYDEQLLPIFDSLRLSDNHKQFFLLHTIGSHWYYNIHVPERFQVFQPVTNNRVVTTNTDEQIINSYDNTALYMDFVVDTLIARLTADNALVIYLSDHGESLGENGNYLHAAGAEETKYPACIIWYSDKYQKLYPHKVEALHQNAKKLYRTDFLFYSILSAAGIEAQGNNANFDIFLE